MYRYVQHARNGISVLVDVGISYDGWMDVDSFNIALTTCHM